MSAYETLPESDNEKADVVIISSDGKGYKLQSTWLASLSSVLGDLLAMNTTPLVETDQDPEEKPQLKELRLSEDSTCLTPLFQLMLDKSIHLNTAKEYLSILSAGDKYHFSYLKRLITSILMGCSEFVDELGPLDKLIIASRLDNMFMARSAISRMGHWEESMDVYPFTIGREKLEMFDVVYYQAYCSAWHEVALEFKGFGKFVRGETSYVEKEEEDSDDEDGDYEEGEEDGEVDDDDEEEIDDDEEDKDDDGKFANEVKKELKDSDKYVMKTRFEVEGFHRMSELFHRNLQLLKVRDEEKK